MKAFRHTGIVVSDLEKTLGFYRDTLGLEVKSERVEKGEYIDKLFAMKGVRLSVVKLASRDGNLIELLYCHSYPGKTARKSMCDTGYTHIAFTVDDLDREYERLKKIGVEFNSPPQVPAHGKAKLVFCRDPEGNLIELVEEL